MVNSNDVCRIIKACVQSGVRELHFGALTLLFGPRDPSVQQGLEMGETNPFMPVQNDTPEAEAAQNRNIRDEMDEMRLLDPLEYENRLAEGMNEGEDT